MSRNACIFMADCGDSLSVRHFTRLGHPGTKCGHPRAAYKATMGTCSRRVVKTLLSNSYHNAVLLQLEKNDWLGYVIDICV